MAAICAVEPSRNDVGAGIEMKKALPTLREGLEMEPIVRPYYPVGMEEVKPIVRPYYHPVGQSEVTKRSNKIGPGIENKESEEIELDSTNDAGIIRTPKAPQSGPESPFTIGYIPEEDSAWRTAFMSALIMALAVPIASLVL